MLDRLGSPGRPGEDSSLLKSKATNHRSTQRSSIRRSSIVNETENFLDFTRPSCVITYTSEESGKEMSERGSSLVSGVTNLAHTVLGTGVLALPAAVASAGMALGLTFLLLGAGLGVLSNYLLGQSAITLDGRQSFTTMADAILPGLSIACEVAVIFNCLGSAIGYLIVASTTFEAAFGGMRQVWVIVATACATPISLLRTMDALRVSSALGLGILLLVTLMIFIMYFEPADILSPCNRVGDTSCQGEVVAVGAPLKVIASFVVFTNAYTCQQSLVPIIAELAEPTPAQLSMLIGGAFAIVVPVYLIFCIFGYLQYGAAVKSDILDSLPDNALMSVARVAMGVAVITSFPIQAFATRKAFSNIYRTSRVLCCKQPAAEADSAAAEPEPAELERQSCWARFLGMLINDKVELIVIACVLGVSFTIAMILDDLGKVVSITGALGAASITFVFPGLFYAFIVRGKGWTCLRLAAVAILVFGIVLIPTSLTISLTSA